MRIAMIISSDLSTAGGVPEHVLNLQQELIQLGHQVDIFGPEKNRYPFKNYHPIGNDISVPLPNGNWGAMQIKKNEFIDEINNHFDVCHVHEPYTPFVSWEVIQKVQIPIVATFHSGWSTNSNIAFISNIIPLFKEPYSQNVKASLYVSKLTQHLWEPLSDSRVLQRVIGFGVDSELFQADRKQREPQNFNVLFLARLVKRKGLQYLIEAVAQVKDQIPELQATVVGPGRDTQYFKDLTQQHNVEHLFTFVGEVLGDKRVQYFQAADAFCAPYIDEALGLTLLEALACECPLFGYWNEAFGEFLIKYPQQEKLFPAHGDIPALAEALLLLYQDIKLRHQIEKWCHTQRDHHTWKSMAKRVEAVYQEVLSA